MLTNREIAVYLLGAFTTLVLSVVTKFWLHPKVEKYLNYKSARKNKSMEEDYLKVKDLHDSSGKVSTKILVEVSNLSLIFALALMVHSLTTAVQLANPNSIVQLSLIQSGGYFAFGLMLIQRVLENANLYWRINNFSKYESNVQKKLGYIPKPSAETALPG